MQIWIVNGTTDNHYSAVALAKKLAGGRQTSSTAICRRPNKGLNFKKFPVAN